MKKSNRKLKCKQKSNPHKTKWIWKKIIINNKNKKIKKDQRKVTFLHSLLKKELLKQSSKIRIKQIKVKRKN